MRMIVYQHEPLHIALEAITYVISIMLFDVSMMAPTLSSVDTILKIC